MKYLKSLGLPIVGSALFGCGLLFGSFLLFSMVHLLGVFPLFIYLFSTTILFELWKPTERSLELMKASSVWGLGRFFHFLKKEPLSTSYLKCLCIG
jgi:hypothetical protein